MKILICGLPGSGKTWLAERLVQNIDNCAWYNADIVRSASNDWDFSKEGRSRQAMRMKTFADFEKSNGRFVICDFVAPTKTARDSFEADYLIWLDTIKEGRVVDNKKNELKNSKIAAKEMAGIPKRKENLAALLLSQPDNKAVEIVTPDLETPGIIANA